MPDKQNDKAQRQDFYNYFSNICKEWKVEKSLENLILKHSEPLSGVILGEYFEAIKKLVKYTDQKKYPGRYNEERRKGYPRGGRSVDFTLGREGGSERGQYRLVTFFYSCKEKKIYDFHINGTSIINEPGTR
jgi:hypothetical protein